MNKERLALWVPIRDAHAIAGICISYVLCTCSQIKISSALTYKIICQKVSLFLLLNAVDAHHAHLMRIDVHKQKVAHGQWSSLYPLPCCLKIRDWVGRVM